MKKYDVILEEIYSEDIFGVQKKISDLNFNYLDKYKKILNNNIISSNKEIIKKILSNNFKTLNAEQKNLQISKVINQILGIFGYSINNLTQILKQKPIFIEDNKIDDVNLSALYDAIIKKIYNEDNKIVGKEEKYESILKNFKHSFYYLENDDSNNPEINTINYQNLDTVVSKISDEKNGFKQPGKKLKSSKLKILLWALLTILMTIFLNYSIFAKSSKNNVELKKNTNPKIENVSAAPEYNIVLNKIHQDVNDYQASLKTKKDTLDKTNKDLQELTKQKTKTENENEKIKTIILDHEADEIGLSGDDTVHFVNIFKDLDLNDWDTDSYKKFIKMLKNNDLSLQDVAKQSSKHKSIRKKISPSMDKNTINEFISDIKNVIKYDSSLKDRRLKEREMEDKKFLGKIPFKIKERREKEDREDEDSKESIKNQKSESSGFLNKIANIYKYGSDINKIKGKYKQHQETIKEINNQIKVILEKKGEIKKDIDNIKNTIEKYKQSEDSLKSNFDLLQNVDEISQDDVVKELEGVSKSILGRSTFKYQEKIMEHQYLIDSSLNSLSEKVYDQIISNNSNFEKLKTDQKNKIIKEFLEKNQSDPSIKKGLDGINILELEIKKLYEDSEKFYEKDITPEDLQLAKKLFVVNQVNLLDKNLYNYDIQYDIDENGNFFIENNDDYKKLEYDFDNFTKGNKEINKKFENILSKFKSDKNDLMKTMKTISDLESMRKESKNKDKIDSKLQNIKEKFGEDIIKDFYEINNLLKSKYKFANLYDTLLFLKITDFEKKADNSEIDKNLQLKLKNKTEPLEKKVDSNKEKKEQAKQESEKKEEEVISKDKKQANKETVKIEKESKSKKTISLNEKQSSEMKILNISDEIDYLSLIKIKPNLKNWNKQDYIHFVKIMKENDVKLIQIAKTINDEEIKKYLNEDLWDIQKDDIFEISGNSAQKFKELIKNKSSQDVKKDSPDKKIKSSKDFMEKVGINKDEFKSLKKISVSFTEKNWTVGEYKDFIKSLKDNGIKLSDVEKHINDNTIKDNINSNIWVEKSPGKWKVDSEKIKEFKELINKKMIGESSNLIKILKQKYF